MPPRKRSLSSQQDEPEMEDLLKDVEQLPQLRASLLDWYDANHRVLPWRRNPHSRLPPSALAAAAAAGFHPAPEGLPLDETIYRTWVCEVMSQQTQVARVAEYFGRWVARWPRVADLAAADQDAVNEAWAGLGYYRRARYLLDGARHVARECAGAFPRTAAGLLAVPGVGPYTAAAIASTACGEPVPVLDGNVVRVLTRLLARAGDPAAMAPRLTAAAAALLDPGRPGDFNQAMMELGATVCVPGTAPRCDACPLAGRCAALRRQREHWGEAGPTPGVPGPRVTDYPTKVEKAARREVEVAVAVLEVRPCCGTGPGMQAFSPAYLLVKRPEKGLLAGLWQFPLAELEGGGEESAANQQRAVDSLLAGLLPGLFDESKESTAPKVVSRRALGEVVHIFSHIRMTIRAEHVLVAASAAQLEDWKRGSGRSSECPECQWLEQEALDAKGLSSSVQKVLKLYKSAAKEKRQSITRFFAAKTE
ncbi:hypothetical protein APUTEX25_005463 [Auxenochlorella protothecoides]|uniref:Adenine DNA glycosylase n=1 Tax=Auxenochlorella protothecoides TaxID=3075 RepID=A0A3M7KZK1_AUXPR|nr:hypothetical protein APUTEX25_005463 [Auxenochlorella protothecoides]|eukprot:RMZ55185.1 hypothetical protein APUTEX25_005463 [Auxenochlorella protothecoides]